jgi:hypothetical protein
MPAPWTGILATDSQGVLNTLQVGDLDPQEQETPVDLDRGEVVLDCLRPDWDLLREIQSAMQLLPQVTLQYVKGHQDKTTPYLFLDLMGQLNVDADEQAGDFNLEHGEYRPFTLMFPSTRAHLQLRDGTVTSRYFDVLVHEATAKPLLDYIGKKNGLDSSTLQAIHWKAHAMAIKRTAIPHTHVAKLLHHMLPTHKLANKFDGGARKCPLCGSLHEDRLHIMSCDHDSRRKWRDDFLTGLRDFHLQSNTSPLLSTLMIAAFRQLFATPRDGNIILGTADYHPTLRQLIRQQNRIGWDQMFLGRFCVEWSQHQRRYLEHQRTAEDLHPISLAWQASLIQCIWERWYHLWKLRNQDVHGNDQRTQAEASRREASRQLGEIYRNRNLYETHVQKLLHGDISDHEHHDFRVTRNWISVNAPIFRESLQRVKKRALSGMRSIRSYFGSR